MPNWNIKQWTCKDMLTWLEQTAVNFAG